MAGCTVSSSPIQSASAAAAAARGGRYEVYVAAMPLRAARGPAQLLMSTAYSFGLWDFQHFMVLLKLSSSQVLVCDFQPRDPENIYVALAALSGGKVPGTVKMRKLKMLPKRKCWFIAYSKMDTVNAIHKFNESWETDLKIGHHDCRNYTNGLVERLTGVTCVLEKLRRTSDERN